MVRRILFAVVLLASCIAHSSPVNSMLGSNGVEIADVEEEQNLWVWPTETRNYNETGYKSPKTIWVPELGVWYTGAAENGYFFGSGSNIPGDSGEDFVTTYASGGYGWGTFLELKPGHYWLGCNTDNVASFRFGFYQEVEGGYQWFSRLQLTKSSGSGYYERVFTVPEGTALTMFEPTSTNKAYLTTTNIEIYRLD